MIKNLSKWPKVQLEDLSVLIDYGLTTSASLENVGPKFLRITDIQDGYVNWDSVPFCLCNTEDKEKYKLATGDIVFARTGATTGKSYLIRECPDGTVFASYLIRVKPNSKVNPTYLYRFFQTPDYWEQIMSRSAGTAQAGVNATKLKSILLPLPPLPEQQRIAAILDKADALREKRRRAIAKLDELQKSVFLEMFGDPVSNPKGWEKLPFGKVFKSIRYGIGSPPPYYETGIPFIRATNIKEGTILKTDLKKISSEDALKIGKCKVKYGDLIIVRSGVNSGDCALVPKEYNEAYAAYDLIIEIDLESAIFYNYLINSTFGKQLIKNLTRRAAQPHLNADQLKNLEIVVPSEKYINLFAKKTNALMRLKAKQIKSLDKLDILFLSLQQRAFSGELFTQQANEELNAATNEEKPGQMSLFDLMG